VSHKPSLAENIRFLFSMLAKPGIIGAVAPSSPALAKRMASFVDPEREGLILEIGPGTGPVTKALLERGIAPERLVLVEYETQFCDLLARRFPGVKIVQGDAYALKDTLAGHIDGPVSAAVSSLPLLVRPEEDRFRLLTQAFDIMGPEGIFIQFTYGLAVKPMPIYGEAAGGAFAGKGSAPVILNIPPARVWRYWLTEAAKAARTPVAA
jgi:phosphatidylethanolamine/phosphatidyl-N-methylethanolamine N-methyltransferase